MLCECEGGVNFTSFQAASIFLEFEKFKMIMYEGGMRVWVRLGGMGGIKWKMKSHVLGGVGRI